MHETKVALSPIEAGTSRRIRWPERFDVAIVLALAALYAFAILVSGSLREEPWFSPIVLLSLVPLLWRSQAPALVLAITMVFPWLVMIPIGTPRPEGDAFIFLPVLVALGGVAARSRLWISAVGLGVVYASLVLWQTLRWPRSDFVWIVASTATLCLITWGLGRYAGRVRQRVQKAQADYEDAVRSVETERRRIGAELNVIISEAIRRMRRQAAVARAQVARDRTGAAAAFAEIESTGAEAMHELRRLLHVLHDDPGLDDGHEPPPAPESTRRRIARKLADIDGTDAAITAAVIAATMFLAAPSFGAMRMPASLFLGVVLVVVLWRRSFPIAVFIIVVAGNAAAVLLFRSGDFALESQVALPSMLVALAAVAAGRPLWASIPAVAIAWTYGALPSLAYPALRAQSLLTDGVVVVAVWVAAFVTGRRRRRIVEIESAQEAAAREVGRERARIAYELHDVIGHSITIMVLQAAGARRIIDQDPVRAAAAIAPIEQSGADAARELKQLLRVMDGAAGQSSPFDSEDIHRLADIDDFIDRIRPAVADIQLRTVGQPGRLESSVDLAAYSVVREALANALKHGGPDVEVTATFTWLPSELRIEVLSSPGGKDSGPEAPLSGGYGLLGVQERVRLVGGSLNWSWDADRFRVEAGLPLASSPTD